MWWLNQDLQLANLNGYWRGPIRTNFIGNSRSHSL